MLLHNTQCHVVLYYAIMRLYSTMLCYSAWVCVKQCVYCYTRIWCKLCHVLVSVCVCMYIVRWRNSRHQELQLRCYSLVESSWVRGTAPSPSPPIWRGSIGPWVRGARGQSQPNSWGYLSLCLRTPSVCREFLNEISIHWCWGDMVTGNHPDRIAHM